MKYNRKHTCLLLGGLGLTACSQPLPESSPPNIIYVFPDQFRNHALGFWDEPGFNDKVNFRADPVHTPHLNQFAKESVVLTSAFSNFPLSSPHRGILLTGMYPEGNGVVLNCNSNRPISSLKENAITVSDVLSEAGYDCAYIGKLHTDFPIPNDPERPGQYVEASDPVWDAYTSPERRHGFNYWYSYGTFDVHKQPHYWDTEGKRHEIREWSPKHEADKAIAYLQNKGKERDAGKPFFMMVAMNPPHSPYASLEDCMEEDYNLYKDVPIDRLLVRPNADLSMEKTRNVPYYFASVTGVDREFGRIVAALKELGLDKNTIVVFASDHGETMCSQGTDDPKNSPYAESVNIPFLVRYPEKLEPRVDDLLLSAPDIMPTLLGLCGLENKIPESVQGKNLSILFFDEKAPVERPQAALYLQNKDGEKDEHGLVRSYFPSSRGIKTHRYTLAFYIDKENHQLVRTLFYDDQKDPYQLTNIQPDPADQSFRELCAQLSGLLKETDDPWYRERILSDWIPYD